MSAFEIDWTEVGARGPNPGVSSRTPNTWQENQRANLCDPLRQGRRELRWTLAELARRSGLSASQLSRIERGQIARSAVFALHPEDLHLVRTDRRITFAHALLASVADGIAVSNLIPPGGRPSVSGHSMHSMGDGTLPGDHRCPILSALGGEHIFGRLARRVKLQNYSNSAFQPDSSDL
ncbi:helix-turn-helix domain-containing protein [Sphingomonas sp. 22176]|uniref:helix-turn-helix domain-containing protein n=1 Tax=Sphingomonas sp. 22176 TaxID=3453884 RepID=UPI003F86891E